MIISRTMRGWVALGIGITALLSARPASAQLYMDVVVEVSTGDLRDAMIGYAFTVDNVTPVNSLGMFDINSDGLQTAYPVGIWDAANTAAPVVQGTVPSGIAGAPVASTSAEGLWRMTPVPLTILSPGTRYVIAAFRPGSTDQWAFGTPAPFPGVNYIQGAELLTSSFEFPTEDSGANSHFGPTFGFSGGAAAPEPASLALLTLGAIGFLARRRK